MKLVAHIEEIDKKKWKASFDPDTQGSWGETTKLTSKNKKLPQTKFNKEMPMDEQIGQVVAEMFARNIIEKVNKAFRMFGYKADLMSIPAEADWFLGVKQGRPTINLTTSAFNKAVPAASASEAQDYKFNVLQIKNEILNLLIGNRDAHAGNFVFHKSSQKNYAIDFGLAMEPSYVPEFDFAAQVKTYSKKDNRTKKYLRVQKYLVFWQGFLENNINNFDNWLDEETSKFLKKFTSQAKELEKKHKSLDLDIEEYKEFILGFYSDSVVTLKKNAQDILKQINKELKIINSRLKNVKD